MKEDKMLDKTWLHIVENIDFAFQPIVDINTGEAIAYEALLRNYKDVGFDSIDSFFDTAYEEKILHTLDIKLRKKVLKKIKSSKLFTKKTKIFYNLDNRIIEMPNYEEGLTSKILDKLNIDKDILTFEISEKHKFKSFIEAQTIFNLYQEQGYQIALDDFGTGFSGLKLLYYLNPNHIKIDRFFITDIFKDTKKKLFLTNIINIARSINANVIAEGIETIEELQMCQEIGCDSVQGYYIQRPTTSLDELKKYYPIIGANKFDISNTLNAKIDLSNINSNNDFSRILNKHIILSTTDLNGIITSASQAFCDISGYKEEELIGQNHDIVRHQNTPSSKFIDLWKTIKKGETWIGEIQNQTKEGKNYWVNAIVSPNYDKNGRIIGYISIRQNITEKKQLEELTHLDSLTAVYNKTYFKKQLHKNMLKAKQNNTYLSLILFEIDDFKIFNTEYSYKKGDTILQNIAKKINETVENSTDVFRIGGKEFAIILKEKQKKDTVKIAKNILKNINSLKIKYKINDKMRYISLSAGLICLKGNQINENSNLLISANISLCQAKKRGNNEIEISEFTYESSII